MIRILLTVPNLSSTASPYREMMALARYLPKNNYDVTVCSLRIDGFAETAPLLESLGCRVIVARFRPRGKRFSHLLAFLRDQKLIVQFGPFDIQHSLDFSNSPIEALFFKIHARVFIFSQRSLGRGSRAGIWLKIHLAKKIVAISDAVVQLLTSLGADPEKVEKIPLGIDKDLTNPQECSTKNCSPCILSVGHIQRLKRHHDAIKVLARLVPEIPGLSLLIAGEIYDPNYHQELQNLVGSLGLEQQVHFLGGRDDIFSLMRSASALLHCSESEAFSWVILEAMSVGLPVVSSDSGGPRETIIDGVTGALVAVGDIDGYTSALRKIILDPEWATDLSSNARDRIAIRFSAEEMVARHAEIYQSLILETTGA